MSTFSISPGRAARAALLGLLVLVVGGCSQPSPEKLMASAKERLAKGDRNAAVIQLKNLLQQVPDNGEARLLLGQAMFDGEDFAAAEKELSRALEMKQPHEKVVPTYALALLALGKNDAVISIVEKYRLFDPPAVAVTRTALGDAYLRRGNRERAREAYAAALAAVPGHPRARLGEATLTAVEGRLDEALKEIDEIVATDPKLAEAHAFRADILLAKGDGAGARKALEDAIAADGKFLPARVSLIGLLIDEREFDAAAKLVADTRRLAPQDLRVNYLDASLALRKGDLERARQQVQQVLRYVPDHLPSLVLTAAIDLREKRFTPAENALRKVLAQAPGHYGARQMLVQAYLRMGQPARAKDTLHPLVEKGMPADPQLLLLAGETYLANGDVKAAAGFYQAAAAAGRAQGAAAKVRLGQIALASGRVDEGFKELEAAADLDPGAYQADLAIITLHLTRNEIDKALVAVQALEEKQPDNPLTHQMYGVVRLAQKDLEKARASFEKALGVQPTYLPAAYALSQLDILAKKPDDARKRYEAMIAREPNNDQIYMALANFQTRTDAGAEEVAATLRRAVSANPQAALPRLSLINLHLRAGDSKAALAVAQEALTALPADPRILDSAGVAQEHAGQVNQAIETYQKLAALLPQSVQPLMRLASLYTRQKETDKAIETLRRVQKIAPRERDAVPLMVQAYLAAGRFDDALREVRELQKREPAFAGGLSLEGDIRLAQRDLAGAERLYREALKVEPRANVVAVKLHGVLVANGKGTEADAWAKKWMAANSKDTAMRLHLADLELAARNLKAAAGHYRAVIAVEPNNAVVLNNLAWIGGELGDPKAIDHAQRALKLAPNSDAVLHTYGMLLLKGGEAEKALPYLERATKLAPARNEIRLNYAKALLQAGRKGDARRELEALQLAKESFDGKDEVAGLLKGL